MVLKRRYPALNRVSVGRKLKGEISKRRMTQNVVENCWKTAVRWLASGRNERVFALLLRYNLTLHHHGGTSGMDIIQSGGGRSILPGTPPCSATPMSSISRSLANAPVCILAGCNVTMANKRIDFAYFVGCFAFLCSFDFLRSREINSGGETFELANLSNRKGIFVVRALA